MCSLSAGAEVGSRVVLSRRLRVSSTCGAWLLSLKRSVQAASSNRTEPATVIQHSLPIDLGLAAQSSPRWLYHGTTAAALDSIRVTGLHRARRHHVHLSVDLDTARRAGPFIVLTVDAQAMADDGLLFYRSANGVWLTDAVPARYLQSSNVE
jgi:RNA:NAD 2'-phosphotransferase (TPT1/KptA family)